MDDLVLNFAGDTVLIHSLTQLHFNFFHASLGLLEAERTAQFFRFAAAESGRDHRHSQQLFLKQRYAQSPSEERLEWLMRIRHVFASLPSLATRMYRLASFGPTSG